MQPKCSVLLLLAIVVLTCSHGKAEAGIDKWTTVASPEGRRD